MKTGTGEGTVTSSPTGIRCTAEECTGEFEGTVTLTAIAEPGYVFVGWIGCKHTGATTCEVDMTAATEVTAVFLKEGKEGSRGPEGPAGPTASDGAGVTLGVILPGEHGCANGGTAVIVGVTTTFIYATARTGATDPTESNGAAGGQGPVGPAGAQGPAGPAGQVELVRCKTVKKGKKKKQQCTTKMVFGTVKFTTKGIADHATLSRHGVIYAIGAASVDHGGLSLRLTSLRALRHGHYTLTLISGSGSHERIHSESFTLG